MEVETTIINLGGRVSRRMSVLLSSIVLQEGKEDRWPWQLKLTKGYIILSLVVVCGV